MISNQFKSRDIYSRGKTQFLFKKKLLLKSIIKEHKRRILTEIKRFHVGFRASCLRRGTANSIKKSLVVPMLAAMCWPNVGRTAIT